MVEKNKKNKGKRRYVFLTNNKEVIDILDKIPYGSKVNFIESAVLNFISTPESASVLDFLGVKTKTKQKTRTEKKKSPKKNEVTDVKSSESIGINLKGKNIIE